MFLIGVSLFTVGSALCGIAPNIETLIAAAEKNHGAIRSSLLVHDVESENVHVELFGTVDLSYGEHHVVDAIHLQACLTHRRPPRRK